MLSYVVKVVFILIPRAAAELWGAAAELWGAAAEMSHGLGRFSGADFFPKVMLYFPKVMLYFPKVVLSFPRGRAVFFCVKPKSVMVHKRIRSIVCARLKPQTTLHRIYLSTSLLHLL